MNHRKSLVQASTTLFGVITFVVAVASVAVPSAAHAYSQVEISADEDACLGGWITMNVDVTVDGERFSFNPSCDFSFHDSLKTSKGVACDVSAGMCSGFSPDEKFEVSCDETSPESISISCPVK